MLKRNKKRQDKKVAEGKLTRRLITPEDMKDAIQFLLESAQRYTIVITKSPFDFKSGKVRDSSEVVFEEEGGTSINEAIYSRISRAQEIVIIFIAKDRGMAAINLTSREIKIIADSNALRETLIEFNRKLLLGAHTRLITKAAATVMFFEPLLFGIILGFPVDLIYNPKLQKEVFQGNNGEGSYPPPSPQAETVFTTGLYIWPAFLLAAIFIVLVIWRSGPLRVWPETFTLKSFVKAVYIVRFSKVWRSNLNAIFVVW